MDGLFDYHAEADHARRLAEITVQPNVAEELRRVAEEFDRLADELMAREPEFHDREIIAWSRASDRRHRNIYCGPPAGFGRRARLTLSAGEIN